MAFSDNIGAQIGEKYGQSIDDFAKSSTNAVEDVLLLWCNDRADNMRKIIQEKARTKGASTLAQSIAVVAPVVSVSGVKVQVVTDQDYYDYVDKGVKGVKNKSKAPGSPYSFRTIGAGPKMIASFKRYIAETGTTRFKKKQLVQKNKKKQASAIDQAAKQMAIYTKIGGIKPMKYIEKTVTPKAIRSLSTALAAAFGANIRVSIMKK